MDHKIDVSEIMRELEDEIKAGLAEKRLTVTDISILIGKHLEKTKEKILKDTGDLMNSEIEPDNEVVCKKCKGHLKKTKK